jgi:transcriptional regulator with XRE-family HTH domain/tetratricopeptide (TPR) repeat protein
VADTAGAEDAARRHRLAQRRRALGLTQEELAALLGIERSTVMRWEHGKTQPLPRIQPKLARALQVPAGQLSELLGGPVPAGPGPAAPPVPRQLPAAVADFTGRAAELAALTRLPDDAVAGAAGTVVVSAISGTAGVGKTALAVYWAHRVADQFPDGQLYVNLRGFDPVGTPAHPAEVIRGFLDALGVPRERIPPRFDAQAGLYRSLVAERKMLIVLDSARDEQQVRPLLPASPASLVLITSRNQLAGLAANGARLLTLDVLPHHEAIQLLTARIGAARAAAEPAALAEIAGMCALLPLALTVAAARAAARPTFPLAALAAELRDITGRLDALDAGDPAASVRAVFASSYQQLSTESARLFRLLGLYPGSDISALAAASLAGTAEPEARRLLRELTRAHLIAEHTPGRYAFHDLLRAYATSQAHGTDTEAEREAATGRALDHYLHTAYRAAELIRPHREPIIIDPPRPCVTSGQPPDRRQAVAWFEAEHQGLLAAITLAAGSGLDRYAWQLPWTMMPFLDAHGYYQEWAASQRTALAAATRLGDTAGQATSSRMLANAVTMLGDYDAARAHLEHSLDLYRGLGDRFGEAKTYQDLNVLAERQRRYADALSHSEHALRLYQAIGHEAGETEMLNAVGWIHALLGDYQEARASCQQALARCAAVGHHMLEAYALDSLGYAEHHLGNFSEAAACYQRALRISRESGDRQLETMILTHVGDARQAAGELPLAREAWQQALDILEDMQHPDADQVRAKLEGVDTLGKRHPPPGGQG